MVTHLNEEERTIEKAIDDLWKNSTKDFCDLQPGEWYMSF